MDIIDAIRDIREANDSNRLVIFVGSGVSRNSGVPSWGQLVQTFAKKIAYERCDYCPQKCQDCLESECKIRYAYTSDELLRIPQYYFNTYGGADYYQTLYNCLDKPSQSNVIDDLIFRLLPHYIITTNYDRLLEDSKEINRSLYSVIIEDGDLLQRNKPRGIIKMHGDIKAPESIVLKEDDYLEYEQNHLLIQTLIKALLIDHTFIFLGYSLTDNNLKLIISWINFLAKSNEIKKRPTNYIVQVTGDTDSDWIHQYYRHSNIEVIDALKLPEKLVAKSRAHKLSEPGTYLHACLEAILDDINDADLVPAIDRFWPKLSLLSMYRRPSMHDIKGIQRFQSATQQYYDVLRVNSDNDFKLLKELLCTEDNRSERLRMMYLAAGVRKIVCGKEELLVARDDDLDFPSTFQLYLNNDYSAILTETEKNRDLLEKAYYDYLIIPDLSKCLSDLKEGELDQDLNNNIIALLIYKWDRMLVKKMMTRSVDHRLVDDIDKILEVANRNEKAALANFDSLFHGKDNKSAELRGLLEKHETTYLHSPNTIHFGSDYGEIFEMQSIVYDYYFFFKIKYIVLDRFKETKELFSLYVKSILCTYSPEQQRGKREVIGLKKEPLSSYTISNIDFDIIVKFIDFQDLRKWCKQYKVKHINYCVDNIAVKFENLLKATVDIKHRATYGQLFSFLVLIEYMEIDDEEILYIAKTAISELIFLSTDESAFIDYLKCMTNCFSRYSNVLLTQSSEILLKFLENENYRKLVSVSKEAISRLASIFSDGDIEAVKEAINLILEKKDVDDKTKCEILYAYRKIIGKQRFLELKEYIDANFLSFSTDDLLIIGYQGYFDSFTRLQEIYINGIEKEIERRKSEKSLHFPDAIDENTKDLALLAMNGIELPQETMKKYAEYSDYLAFILDPDIFDYSKVNLSDYMWGNFYRDSKYLQHFIEHKSEILTNEVELDYHDDLFTHDQEKIVLRYLLNDDELWKYGNR